MRITLEQMLAARDRRADIQNKMLAGGGHNVCLVCLTLNIAGDVKRTPMTRMLFEKGVSEFDALGLCVLEHLETDDDTGSEAFWLVDADADEVKRRLENIEDDEGMPAYRLFDFDVLIPAEAPRGSSVDDAPVKLSRGTGRKCLICERPAAECARSRNHGLEAVRAETNRLLSEFCADVLGQAAHDALIAELETTPKPGLVDLNNSGSHPDMDENMFRRSAEALVPYFRDAVLLGIKDCSMKELRPRGLEAEAEMFEATGGVNTHKGLIYSMGLLLAGMGKALSHSGGFDRAIAYAADLAGEDAEAELRKSADKPSTHGGRVYKKYGVKGASGEAVSGFPNAVRSAERLGIYKKNYDINTAGVFALIDGIKELDDTNLLHRGGEEGLEFARSEAARIAGLPDDERIEAVRRMDDEMIKRNLSPGGSADMLALSHLLDKWKELSLKL